MLTFELIEQARARIGKEIYESPLARSHAFSEMAGARTFFKLENLQMTGSFKERGALNKLLSLSDEERRRGVVTSSAGNHAQGVAYHARRLGVNATVVMPQTTPLVKVTNTRRHGARVVLHGVGYDEAEAEAHRIENAEGFAFVHPFDDELVMAGNGTIGLEVLEQNPYIDAIVVPVGGGGGLISGVAVAVKETNPRIKVIGVESEAMPAMKRSVEAGRVVDVPRATTIADGIAVRRVSDRTLGVVRRYVDDLVTVPEGAIAEAILFMLETEKTVVEGAGAVGIAALMSGALSLPGKKVAILICGGNIDMNVISKIIERGLARQGRLVELRVALDDRPGALSAVTGVIAAAGANVNELRHDRRFAAGTVGDVTVELTVETRGAEHLEELVAALRAQGYAVEVGRGA